MTGFLAPFQQKNVDITLQNIEIEEETKNENYLTVNSMEIINTNKHEQNKLLIFNKAMIK